MVQLNGHGPATPDPMQDAMGDMAAVAEAAYAEEAVEEDIGWADLDPTERQVLTEHAARIAQLGLKRLAERGFRILPPSAVLRPKDEQEAMMMLQAAKDFFDALKRKGRLVAGAKPKLILPPGVN